MEDYEEGPREPGGKERTTRAAQRSGAKMKRPTTEAARRLLKRHRLRVLVIAATTVFLLGAIVAVDRYYRGRVQSDNDRALHEASTVAKNDLETGLRLRTIVADDLEAYLHTSLPNLTQNAFSAYAQSVLDHTPETRALEFADSQGIIRFVYPLKGNEKALNLNLFTRPAAPYVRQAMTTGKTNLSAPVVTAQGSYSIVIRAPIFDHGTYLGLAQTVVDVGTLLNHLSATLSPRFSVRLENARHTVLWGEGKIPGPVVRMSIASAGADWYLVVGWKQGEPPPSGVILLLIWAVGIILSTNLLLWIGKTAQYIRVLSESVEQKSADLRISQERYRTLVETADDMILQIALDGRVVFANNAYRKLGHPEDGGSPKDELVIGEGERLEIIQRVPEVLRRGTLSVEYAVDNGDGSSTHRYGRMNLIRNSDGEPDSVLAIIRDITEEKRLQDEASRLQAQFYQSQKLEAVGRLAAGIAHDFNNIIMVINGNAELIRIRFPNDDRLDSVTQAIINAGSRAASLVSQLLSYSRDQVLEPVVLSLNDEVTQMREILKRLFHENIEIRFEVDSALWNIRADEGQIEQVLMNLALNARDAMPKGGTLTFETGNVVLTERLHDEYGEIRPGEYVRLIVRDTGSGMTFETKQHLFEPFYSTKGREGGTGLGLATVYGIIQQNGGHISVTSQVGRGTEFTIHLARAHAETAGRAETEDEGKAPIGQETILLAEDDRDIRTLARQVLEGQDYSVIEAEDGRHALELAEEYQGRIDLLLTDMIMPRMGGKALAEKLTAAHPHLKLIFMSGYNDDTPSARHQPAEGPNLLPKPFTLSTLVTRVRNTLDQPR